MIIFDGLTEEDKETITRWQNSSARRYSPGDPLYDSKECPAEDLQRLPPVGFRYWDFWRPGFGGRITQELGNLHWTLWEIEEHNKLNDRGDDTYIWGCKLKPIEMRKEQVSLFAQVAGYMMPLRKTEHLCNECKGLGFIENTSVPQTKP